MTDQPYTGPEVDAAVRILREDAQAAHNKALMARLDAMEQRFDRLPTKEMTAEEKAAEYDRMMAGQKGGAPAAQPPAGGTQPPAAAKDAGKPPAPAAKPPTPPEPAQVRKDWWANYQQGQS